MRRLLVALGLIASMSDALAGGFETPILRGSDAYVPVAPAPQLIKWSGFYAGGHVGYGFAAMNFAGATQVPIAHMLRELILENEQHPSQWQVLGKTDTGGASAGGFFGYNNRWEDVILGFELNYSRVSHRADAPVSPIARVTSTSNGLVYLVNLTGGASMHITDLATLRARAGVQVENFLPYLMIGLAAGRANISRSATVTGTETIPSDPPVVTPFSFTEGETKNGAFLFGWSLGGGLDMMVMPNVFLRAEAEYVAFSPVWEIKANIATVRLGGGIKF
ncbi:MAG TPA: outer membrane beta-barrel protein [Xanthobacteraceae bacterium]|nr:outer membrane beta-barrel protein [Xanthobacteraceae bacterium]HZO45000.1 outer membrane beta-barrel protein [Xanthobacteraceae bacterium]